MAPSDPRYHEYERCLDVLREAAKQHNLRIDSVNISGGTDDRVCQQILRFDVDVYPAGGFIIERVITDATRVYATDDFEAAVDVHMELLAAKCDVVTA